MLLRGSALRRSYDDHWAGLAPETARGPEPRPPEANQPSPLIEPAEPIPTRARTSALGGYVTGHGIWLCRSRSLASAIPCSTI